MATIIDPNDNRPDVPGSPLFLTNSGLTAKGRLKIGDILKITIIPYAAKQSVGDNTYYGPFNSSKEVKISCEGLTLTNFTEDTDFTISSPVVLYAKVTSNNSFYKIKFTSYSGTTIDYYFEIWSSGSRALPDIVCVQSNNSKLYNLEAIWDYHD